MNKYVGNFKDFNKNESKNNSKIAVKSTVKKIEENRECDADFDNVNHLTILDVEIHTAINDPEIDLNNYIDRVRFIQSIEDRLEEHQNISLANGTYYKKHFTPSPRN